MKNQNPESLRQLERVMEIARWQPLDEEVHVSLSFLPHDRQSMVVAVLAYRGSTLEARIEPDTTTEQAWSGLDHYAAILVKRTAAYHRDLHRRAARDRRRVINTPDGTN